MSKKKDKVPVKELVKESIAEPVSSQGGIVAEMLRHYLGDAADMLELDHQKTLELFNISTEKFERERELSQEQLRSSTDKFVRRMEQSNEYLRMSSERFLREMEKSHKHFRSSSWDPNADPEAQKDGSFAKGGKGGKAGKNKSFVKLAGNIKLHDIIEKFDEMGIIFTEQSFNKQIWDKNNPNSITEIKIQLENDDLVVAVEVKLKPSQADIDEHIEKVEKLQSIAYRRNDRREFRGAIAGTINPKVREYAESKGFLIL